MTDPIFPQVVVTLEATDGEVFGIISTVAHGLRTHHVDTETINIFIDEAADTDSHDALLHKCMEWVTVR